MVQAILNGEKTQTRRVIKYNKEIQNPVVGWSFTEIGSFCVRGIHEDGKFGESHFKQPISVGDEMWVRETWATSPALDHCKPSLLQEGVPVEYKAGGSSLVQYDKLYVRGKWRPSIFMPKHICRLRLKVTKVGIERLQHISSYDAVREGITDPSNPVESFKALWYSINGKESWDENPWVWVYDFKITSKN